MRMPFTAGQAYESGLTPEALRWRVKRGDLQRLMRGTYIEGGEALTPIERAVAVVVATGGIASGTLAGMLYGLDSVRLQPPFATIPVDRESRYHVRRANVTADSVLGVPCTDGLRTLEDLARAIDDIAWEQAMESALRKKLVTIGQLEACRSRRIRRVMSLRPPQAPPAESLLETMMVQLIRNEPSLPVPTRQVVVLNKWDSFVARVDLAWPKHGIFLELDGQHHKNQPVYDANRQTAVVAAKGWLPGRFTWHEVTRAQKSTLRRLTELFEQASQLRRSAKPPGTRLSALQPTKSV